MTKDDVQGYLGDLDICIREACGGWIVMAPSEFTDDGLATGIHVFTSDESVIEFVRQRMAWFKRERNKGSFDHGDNDYPGDPSLDPTPPKLSDKK